MDDVQALARLKEGDREAFEELYRKYWRRLYNTAYRRLLSREDSEEVIQDLFVYIWSKRDTLEITTTLEAYLQGALKFSIYNFIRSRKVKEAYLDSLNHTATPEQNFIEDTIYYEELAAALEKSIEHLPEKLKKVYLLSRKENYTYKEIADQLNIPLDTVEKQMGKALKLLRQSLKDFVAALLVWVHTLTI
ncbi:RNA polymerase sigma factor [Telluribacter sp. SYSU D00476]|uniref:RNA polymerase sigma factor n=1 Tax=Telluribacter sp. SYSU D00476 TaxID=2811430 RepID=UPI001FF59870|nr:RNA polymerase sigma-70 factor [Telluribacter sp. SYSU D00476]